MRLGEYPSLVEDSHLWPAIRETLVAFPIRRRLVTSDFELLCLWIQQYPAQRERLEALIFNPKRKCYIFAECKP